MKFITTATTISRRLCLALSSMRLSYNTACWAGVFTITRNQWLTSPSWRGMNICHSLSWQIITHVKIYNFKICLSIWNYLKTLLERSNLPSNRSKRQYLLVSSIHWACDKLAGLFFASSYSHTNRGSINVVFSNFLVRWHDISWWEEIVVGMYINIYLPQSR